MLLSNLITKSKILFTDPSAPPRPPLPSEGIHHAPSRPPPPPMLDTTDDESEDLFQNAPSASQGPIMVRSTFVMICTAQRRAVPCRAITHSKQ